MKIMVLDDDDLRHRLIRRMTVGSPHAWTTVKTAKEACDAMTSCRFDLVLLDHDLKSEHYVQYSEGKTPADGEGCGRDVTKFIIDMPVDQRPKQAVLHSMNPDGRTSMLRDLWDAEVKVDEVVFGSDAFKKLMKQLSEKSI